MDWDYKLNGKWYEVELENGKKYRIDKNKVDNDMTTLELSEFEVIEMWLEDNDILVNEEVEELTQKAKANGSAKVSAKSTEPKKKTQKERVRKENPTKEKLISELAKFITENELATDVIVENVGKIITFKVGDTDFKLDLIQKRKPKEK